MEEKIMVELDPLRVKVLGRLNQIEREKLDQQQADTRARRDARYQTQRDARPRPLRGLSDTELGELWEEADRPNAGGRAGVFQKGDIIRERDIREHQNGAR